jgi:hypothetical protein
LVETGRVFTKVTAKGSTPPLAQRFIELYEEINLPPVQLHDATAPRPSPTRPGPI